MGVRLEACAANTPYLGRPHPSRRAHAMPTSEQPASMGAPQDEGGIAASPLHRALVVKLVLAVLDDGRDCFQRQVAFGVLYYVLQVEVLDREVVVAVLVRPAHGLVIGLAHLRTHHILLAE